MPAGPSGPVVMCSRGPVIKSVQGSCDRIGIGGPVISNAISERLVLVSHTRDFEECDFRRRRRVKYDVWIKNVRDTPHENPVPRQHHLASSLYCWYQKQHVLPCEQVASVSG